jgi:hypothetical protein
MTAGLAGCAVALAGCGGSTKAQPTPKPSGEAAKSGPTVIADAKQALLAARSVHVRGGFTSTKAGITTRQVIDVQVARGADGSALATGTVTTLKRATGKSSSVALALIRVGSQLYVRGDRAYYASIGPKAAAVAGRWLSTPITQDPRTADLTDIKQLAAGLSSAASATNLGVRQLGPFSAVAVRAASGAVLYVAATGPPRPLRLLRAAGSVPASSTVGTLDFAGYDVAVSVKAPAGAIDIAKVRG